LLDPRRSVPCLVKRRIISLFDQTSILI